MGGRIVFVPLVAALALSGCGLVRERAEPQEALPFEAVARPEARRGRDFTVTVEAGGADLAVTRESVRYPGVAYCVLTFGKSAIDWTLDPATGDWAYRRLSGGSAAASGRCAER